MNAKTQQLLNSYNLTVDDVIYVVMYLRPEIYLNSSLVTASVNYDSKNRRYHTDVNPSRRINGPLSDYGQELEPPIKEEYDRFIDDCIWLVEELGFTIIKRFRSIDSEKSEYVILFGIDDTPCGSIVYDLRISDHPLDATFPEELKDEALKFLKMKKVLDESATKAGINFRVEKVTVGSVANDSWDRAFDRLFNKLKLMKKRIKTLLKTRRNK